MFETLIYAIIDRAIRDLKKGNVYQAIDAVRFFESDWFETMAEVICLDVPSTRVMISDLFEKRCKTWYGNIAKEYNKAQKMSAFVRKWQEKT